MIKKALGVGMILGIFLEGIAYGACTVTETCSRNSEDCTVFVEDSTRYSNSGNGIYLWYMAHGYTQGDYNYQKQIFDLYNSKKKNNLQYTFNDKKGIGNFQKIMGSSEDCKLGKETAKKFMTTDWCSEIDPNRKKITDEDCPKGYAPNPESNNLCCTEIPQPEEEEEPQTTTQPEPTCTSEIAYEDDKECFCKNHQDDEQCTVCGITFQTCNLGYSSTGENVNDATNTCSWQCEKEKEETVSCSAKCSSYARAGQGVGMGMNADCLVHGGCSLDVYKTLGIRANSSTETRTSVLGFFQDTISAATFFIGTILTISFLWAGFKFVTAGANGKDPSEAKKGMFYAVIGFALVMSAYAIIRFVQYLASTGG